MKANPLTKLRLSGRWPILLLLGTLLGSNFMVLPVQANGVVGNGTPASCTEFAFDTALIGGGSVKFSCGGLKTITVTNLKQISVNTTIDGDGLITLSGSNTYFFQVFFANSLTLRNITLANGSSSIAGAIENFGTTTISKSQLVNNHSIINAGAIVNYGHLVLTDSTLSNNQAVNSGGAIYNDGGTVEVTDTLLAGNKVTGPMSQGGAIANNAGSILLNRVALTNNSAIGSGGGIYSIASTPPTNMTLTNVTLSGNQSTNNGGGGIYQGNGNGTLNFVTAVGNTGIFGAGVYNDGNLGTLFLQNTLLSNNSGGNCDGVVSSSGHNLSSDNNCGLFVQPGDKINTPALLGPLADNGGQTLTHLPLAGSPAINGGQCVVGVTVDQRGILRPVGAACDIGGVEYGGIVPRLSLPLIRR
jgi:predicted outer membrane repeat protein